MTKSHNLDFSLLITLYGIHAKSGSEKRIRKFIKRWLATNVPTAKVYQDTTGNLYVTKGDGGTYPCLCAHIDQVQDFHPKDFTCVCGGDAIFGYSPKMHKQCGLGGDDKNGVFIALSCLQEYDVLKCAFFVGEEIGCVGSSAADMEFFTDCRFCVQIDRRGNSDLVTEISAPLCSDEFLLDADPASWGYAPCHGLMTDVDTLRNNGLEVSCVNMSCGYYEPHTDHEFSSMDDVRKCHAFVCHLIEDCTKRYTFPVQSYGGWYGYGYDDDFKHAPLYEIEDMLYDDFYNIVHATPDITFDEAWGALRDTYGQYIHEDTARIVFDDTLRMDFTI